MNAGDTDYKGAILHVLRGLPRAGKSTLASTIKDGVIVSKDSIRLSLHGKPFVEELESTVDTICRHMVGALLYSGHRVIILDECFLTARSVQVVKETWPDAEVVEHLVPTPPEECIRRAYACGQPYLVPVIERMAEVAEWLR